jgi:RNA polymerase sigma-70 factor (ECF subfamily)
MAIRAEEIETLGAVDIDRDRRLVLRHQQGDVAAFDELYRRYHDRLVGYCVRRVGDRHVAEELAQEAFVKALRAMPRFAGERRFYPWMTVIAQRLCIDHHRRTSRVEPTAEPDPGSVEPDHDAVFDAVDRDHLAAAMDRLAPRHREILELREHRGWSYQQIAVHLDVPMTTVEALLHRARKALRREYLAVAGDDRVGRLGVGVGALGVGVLSRVKGWLAAASPERWAPVLGTAAAAGTIAIGAAVVPAGDDSAADDRRDVELVDVSSVSTAPVLPAASSAPVAVSLPGRPPTAVAVAPADDAAEATPAPDAELAGVGVYTTPEGVAWAEEQNAQQPIHIDLGAVADVGLDPGRLLGAVLTLPVPEGAAP